MMNRSRSRSVSFDRLIQDRIRRSPDLAEHTLREAIQALLDNDVPAAKHLLRDVIKGTVGYAELSRRTSTPVPSLARMFGPRGNPTATKLFDVLAALQSVAELRFEVRRAGRSARRVA